MVKDSVKLNKAVYICTIIDNQKTNNVEANAEIMVRVYKYKSFRHYGGREITTIPFVVRAKYLFSQQDHTHVVELLDGCEAYQKGHKIAISEKDFNI